MKIKEFWGRIVHHPSSWVSSTYFGQGYPYAVVHQLAEAIGKLWLDQAAYQRMSENARRLMEEQFDKYITGSWAANERDLREMNEEDKKAMVEKVDENRHYYVIETSHTTVPAKEKMEALTAAGIHVAKSPADIGETMVRALGK